MLDVVEIINHLLSPQQRAVDGPTAPVVIGLEEVYTLESGQLVIPVTIQTDGVIAGVQAVFGFDPVQLQVGTPHSMGHTAGITVESHLVGAQLRVVMYNVTGQGIASGSETLLFVPVSVLEGATATPPFALQPPVVVADRQARAVPVTLGRTGVHVSRLPETFDLKPNLPNPFYPSTRIIYDVPEMAQVIVAVYDLHDQELVRLADQDHAPGRYEVNWHGRDAQGREVPSGDYLYRLTTSTGFSQTRQMKLLK